MVTGHTGIILGDQIYISARKPQDPIRSPLGFNPRQGIQITAIPSGEPYTYQFTVKVP